MFITGSDEIASTQAALSLSVTTAGYTTSESVEPTPEPTSFFASQTSTFESSTPPPENSSAI